MASWQSDRGVGSSDIGGEDVGEEGGSFMADEELSQDGISLSRPIAINLVRWSLNAGVGSA